MHTRTRFVVFLVLHRVLMRVHDSRALQELSCLLSICHHVFLLHFSFFVNAERFRTLGTLSAKSLKQRQM